jgi:hypothetical protein
LRAEQLRSIAADAKELDVRRTLIDVAEGYETMARRLETPIGLNASGERLKENGERKPRSH